jgi:hypothetical protein
MKAVDVEAIVRHGRRRRLDAPLQVGNGGGHARHVVPPVVLHVLLHVAARHGGAAHVALGRRAGAVVHVAGDAGVAALGARDGAARAVAREVPLTVHDAHGRAALGARARRAQTHGRVPVAPHRLDQTVGTRQRLQRALVRLELVERAAPVAALGRTFAIANSDGNVRTLDAEAAQHGARHQAVAQLVHRQLLPVGGARQALFQPRRDARFAENVAAPALLGVGDGRFVADAAQQRLVDVVQEAHLYRRKQKYADT